MIKQVYFYATKNDLLPVLRAVEEAGALKYVVAGNFTTPELRSYSRGEEIPQLGKASSGTAGTCETFLVCAAVPPVKVESFKGGNGEDRFCVDQLLNPDTVGLTPAGQWNEEILLHGRVATVSDSPASQALMKRFQSAIRKHFVKIKAFYVGSNARKLLESGKRLTISAQSPRDFDLTLAE